MTTKQQKVALEALDAMDDFCRMDMSVDPIGPRRVLEEFIIANGSQEFPREEKALLNMTGELVDLLETTGAIIAGGAITSLFTGQEVNDLDIYFRSKESFSRFMAGLMSGDYGYSTIVNITDRSVTATDHREMKGQFVVFRFFESAQDIFDTFDFTANMGAYDFESGSFVFDKNFFRHNSQRFLEINTKTAYPLISVLRIEKYRKKGYSTSKAQLLRLLLAVTELDLNSWDDVVDQVGGMYGIDPEKLFDRTVDFSIDAAIEQLGKLESIDNNIQYETLCFDEIGNKLKDKLTLQVYEILDSMKSGYRSSANQKKLEDICHGTVEAVTPPEELRGIDWNVPLDQSSGRDEPDGFF